MALLEAKRLAGRLAGDAVLKAGGASIAVRVTSAALAFGLAAALARLLGPAEYGRYAYVFALISLISIPAQVGLPTLLVRETAKALASENWAGMKSLWVWSTRTIISACCLLAFATTVVAVTWKGAFESADRTLFLLGMILMPIMALGNARGAVLRGLHRVVIGQLPEFILRPALMLAIILLWNLVAPTSISARHAMEIHVVAALLSFVAGAWMLARSAPREISGATSAAPEGRAWLLAIGPLAVVSGMQVVTQQADLIMLGSMRSHDEVGIYKVAVSGAALVVFGLQSINLVASPRYAYFHAKGDLLGLRLIAAKSAVASFLISLPVVVCFALFGRQILSLVFGTEYVSAYVPLCIASVGQLINAFFGSATGLLTMSGNEKVAAIILGLAAICNVSLNLSLIPLLGANGAALSAAATLLLWNVSMWIVIRRRLDVDCSVLGAVWR